LTLEEHDISCISTKAMYRECPRSAMAIWNLEEPQTLEFE